jgi:hypothetical protein
LNRDDHAEPYHAVQSFYDQATRSTGVYCQEHYVEWVNANSAVIQVQRAATAYPYQEYSACVQTPDVAGLFSTSAPQSEKCNETEAAAIIVSWAPTNDGHLGAAATAGIVVAIVAAVAALAITTVVAFCDCRARKPRDQTGAKLHSTPLYTAHPNL